MGGGGGGASSMKSTSSTRASAVSAPIVNTPVSTTVTPATARNIGQDASNAVKNQAQARSRLQGVRSTWAAFDPRNGNKAAKLG